MKTYWDYTEKERAEMTEEQVKDLLKAEIMTKGVLSPEEPRYETIEEVKLETEKYFEIHGLIFKNREDAEKVAELNPMQEEYDYYINSKYKFATPHLNQEVGIVNLYRRDDIERMTVLLKKNKAADESNTDKRNEYNKALESVSKVTNGVWDDWYQCKNKNNNLMKVTVVFNEYLTLTEQNKEMALIFLNKVFDFETINQSGQWFGVDELETFVPVEVKESEAK